MEKSDVNRADEGVSLCPSFSVYCSDRQSAASRAVYEVLYTPPQPQLELDEDEFDFAARRLETPEDDFEFEVLRGESFFNGDTRRIFPIFDCDDVAIGGAEKLKMSESVQAASVSLGKLMMDELREEREGNVNSSSSSEVDEEDRVAPRTYCVWKPRSTPELFSPGRCKMSKSTGSCSKRWKLRDLLLRRSNSDCKDSFVFLSPPSSSSNSTAEEAKCVASKSKPLRRSSGKYKASAHELLYVKNRGVDENRKRKSYLPYRNGILGFGFIPS